MNFISTTSPVFTTSTSTHDSDALIKEHLVTLSPSFSVLELLPGGIPRLESPVTLYSSNNSPNPLTPALDTPEPFPAQQQQVSMLVEESLRHQDISPEFSGNSFHGMPSRSMYYWSGETAADGTTDRSQPIPHLGGSTMMGGGAGHQDLQHSQAHMSFGASTYGQDVRFYQESRSVSADNGQPPPPPGLSQHQHQQLLQSERNLIFSSNSDESPDFSPNAGEVESSFMISAGATLPPSAVSFAANLLPAVPELSPNDLTPTGDFSPHLGAHPSAPSFHSQQPPSWRTLDPIATAPSPTQRPFEYPPHSFSYQQPALHHAHTFPGAQGAAGQTRPQTSDGVSLPFGHPPQHFQQYPQKQSFFTHPAYQQQQQQQQFQLQPQGIMKSYSFTNGNVVMAGQSVTPIQMNSGNTTGPSRKRIRRKSDQIDRLYACTWVGCDKAYGTLNHLNTHVLMQSHGEKRTPAEFKELRKQWRRQKREEAATIANNGGRPTTADDNRPNTADSDFSVPSSLDRRGSGQSAYGDSVGWLGGAYDWNAANIDSSSPPRPQTAPFLDGGRGGFGSF